MQWEGFLYEVWRRICLSWSACEGLDINIFAFKFITRILRNQVTTNPPPSTFQCLTKPSYSELLSSTLHLTHNVSWSLQCLWYTVCELSSLVSRQSLACVRLLQGLFSAESHHCRHKRYLHLHLSLLHWVHFECSLLYLDSFNLFIIMWLNGSMPTLSLALTPISNFHPSTFAFQLLSTRGSLQLYWTC